LLLTQPAAQNLLTARATALPVLDSYADTSLDEGGATIDAWREADEPLIPEDGPETWLPLNFYFDDREQILEGFASAHSDEVAQEVVFRFVIPVLPAAKKLSWQMAALAGEHMRSWLMAEWSPYIEVKPSGGRNMLRTPVTKAPSLGMEAEPRPTHIMVEIPLTVTYTTPR